MSDARRWAKTDPLRTEFTDSWQPRVSLVITNGPQRQADDGNARDELPDGRDFIGFGEGAP